MKELFYMGLCIAAILGLLYSVCFRLMVFHPFKSTYYALRDIFLYFKYNKRYVYNGGILNCYAAHFGRGKTLSLVHYISGLYRRYNNRKVYNFSKKCYEIQKVTILSNVEFKNIPFIELTSLNQIIGFTEKDVIKQNDADNIRQVVLVVIDEASVQLNSRNFKDNINAEFLNALLTCRHFHISIFYSSQKFKLVDALLRDVTQQVILCRKVWRFQVQYVYDADELNFASNPSLVKPKVKKGWFITDKDFNAYDTLATVDQLKKSYDEGDFLSEEEILANRGTVVVDEQAYTPSRKQKRFWKVKGKAG